MTSEQLSLHSPSMQIDDINSAFTDSSLSLSLSGPLIDNYNRNEPSVELSPGNSARDASGSERCEQVNYRN